MSRYSYNYYLHARPFEAGSVGCKDDTHYLNLIDLAEARTVRCVCGHVNFGPTLRAARFITDSVHDNVVAFPGTAQGDQA